MFNIAINKYYRFLTLAFLLTSLALIISTRHAYALKNTKPQETSQMLQVKTGDTVYSILQKKGFSEKAIAAFLTNPDIPKKITLTSETKYKFSQSPKSQFKSIKFYELDEDVSYYLEQSNNSIVAKKIIEHFTKKIKSAQGKVNGSIIGSLERKINNKSISYRFLDAYAFKHNLKKELKRNAFFSIVYEEKYDGDFYIKPGEVLKTQIEINGDIETRHFVSYKDGGSFLSTQPILSDRPFYAPVNYVRISSYFNPRRFHPIRKRRIPHLGIDFELPSGAPVFSVQEGTVIRSGKNRAAGNFIVIKHDNGLESFYNHLSFIEDKIKNGYKVLNGEEIGKIGCTGYCTKAHLHLAVKKYGKYVNPILYLKSYPFNKEHIVLAKRQHFESEDASVIR